MKKKLLLIAAICCTILAHGATYFKVNGTYEVTDVNVSALDQNLKDLEYITSGTISFNPTTKVLTMDSVQFATNLTGNALVISSPMTIVLWNTNTIPLITLGTGKPYSMIINANTIICGAGTLELSGINVDQGCSLTVNDCAMAFNQDEGNVARIRNDKGYATLAFDNVNLSFKADADHSNGHIYNFLSCTFKNMNANNYEYSTVRRRLEYDSECSWHKVTMDRSANTNYLYKFCGIPFGVNNAEDLGAHIKPLLGAGSVAYTKSDSTMTFTTCTIYNKQKDAPALEVKNDMSHIVFSGLNYINGGSMDYAFDLYRTTTISGTDPSNVNSSQVYLTRGIQLNNALTYTIKDMEMSLGYEVDEQEVNPFPYGVRGDYSSVLQLQNTDLYIANTKAAGIYMLSNLVLTNEQVANPTDLVFNPTANAVCKGSEDEAYDKPIHYMPFSGTGIDATFTDSTIHRFTKVIKDGQLLILIDGKIYNAQGARL